MNSPARSRALLRRYEELLVEVHALRDENHQRGLEGERHRAALEELRQEQLQMREHWAAAVSAAHQYLGEFGPFAHLLQLGESILEDGVPRLAEHALELERKLSMERATLLRRPVREGCGVLCELDLLEQCAALHGAVLDGVDESGTVAMRTVYALSDGERSALDSIRAKVIQAARDQGGQDGDHSA